MANLVRDNRTDQSYLRAESDCFCNTTLLASALRMFHTTCIATTKTRNEHFYFLVHSTYMIQKTSILFIRIPENEYNNT
jgi:hypothetical protein